MRVLLITQKIDADDDILGVYHEWARHIAKSFEKLSIICLYKGKVELPENISVFSLGKQKHADLRGLKRGFARISYALKFYRLLWNERKEYDAVFVHMNPIYVLLGFFPWRLMDKKIFLWYAHPGKNTLVRMAYFLSDKVITSVPEAFYVRSKKVAVIGQGIDVALFRNTRINTSINSSILFLGRVSPAKRVDILLEAIKILRSEGVQLSSSIVGDAVDAQGGREYEKKLLDFVDKNNLGDSVKFAQSVPNRKTPAIYNRHDIFVNLSPTGYFDKTVLEAMACECVVLASNEAYENVFPRGFLRLLIFEQNNPVDLAKKIKGILALSPEERVIIGRQLRKVVIENHSLSTFGERLRLALD